jgi:chemotaxis protein histidine kinase CheA
MTSLADMLDTVRGESQRREAAAAELAERAAEAAMRVKGEDVPVEEEPMPAEETPAEEAPAEEAPVEETPEEEAKETPEEESKEPKKEEEKEFSASETVEATAETTEVVELSTEPTESIELSAEDAELSVEESVELSTEETVEVSETAEAEVASEEAPAEAEAIVADGGEAEVVAEESTESLEAPEVEQEEQAPVTAAADQPFEAPADRQPVVQVTEAPVAITAGADIPGYTAGSTINDMSEVAQAMEKRIHSLRRVNGGDGEQHIVASITTQYDEARTLTTDAESNMAKINAVVGPEALVASGGHSAPYAVKYDIYAIGSTTVRPVRDMLPKFQADRGGIRFITPPSFASGDYASAVGVWTAAVDAAPYSNTKTSLTVSAAQENTVATDAVTLQLQFGNLMTRAYPELIARHNELALVQHAREAEQNLLTKIGDASTAVTSTNLIGFGRDFLVQVRRAATAYRSRHRLDADARLKVIIPSWVVDAMAADLALAMPGDGTLSVSKAEIEGYLGNIGVDLVASLDQNVFGSQGAGAMTEFPDSFSWYLFAEGTFLFLDGGTLDLGIIRDSTLVGTNDYKMFVETFENVAKVGIESLKITSTISVNGVAAALRDTTGGTAAATIEL